MLKGWKRLGACIRSLVSAWLVVTLLLTPGAGAAQLLRDSIRLVGPTIGRVGSTVGSRLLPATGVLAASTLLAAPNASATSPYDDEFNSSTLDPKWTWIRETPTHWSLTANPGYLRIVTQRKDIFEATNTAPVLLQTSPAGDFEISTKLTMSPTVNYQQAGLVIYGDDDNYVRLTYGYWDGLRFEFGKEINAVMNSHWAGAPTGNTFYLKIVKLGNNYIGYYSQDNSSWVKIG